MTPPCLAAIGREMKCGHQPVLYGLRRYAEEHALDTKGD